MARSSPALLIPVIRQAHAGIIRRDDADTCAGGLPSEL